MKDNSRPIGVFDSGIGGISVLKEIVSLMPEENYIYYGDSANAPYGTRQVTDIQHLSRNCVEFLLEHGAKAIVIACNTATSAAAAMLRADYPDIPVIGIEPALKPAVLWKEHDRIAVMATPMTLKQDKFLSLMHTYEDQSVIYRVPCPKLVGFVENGDLNSPELHDYLQEVLSPYLKKGIDAIVLGCTHYPFVEKMIRTVVGPDIKIFVGSHGTAVELRRRLIAAGLKSESAEQGTVEIYNSCTTDGNAHVALCRKLLAL